MKQDQTPYIFLPKEKQEEIDKKIFQMFKDLGLTKKEKEEESK